MPFYEYKCTSCGKVFEYFARSMQDNGASSCPDCGCEEIKKLFSSFGFKSGSASSGDLVSSAGSGSSCTSCTATSCAGCKP